MPNPHHARGKGRPPRAAALDTRSTKPARATKYASTKPAATKSPRAKSAARGDYGAVPFDRTGEHADELLRVVEQSLGDADYFTREDLLQCDVFAWCATITRYRYIGVATNRLIDRGKLVAMSRTEIALPQHARDYRGPGELLDEYGAAIRQITHTVLRHAEHIDVSTVLRAWTTDEHLTLHVKRTVARKVVAGLARDGEIVRIGPGLYAAREATHATT